MTPVCTMSVRWRGTLAPRPPTAGKASSRAVTDNFSIF